MLNLLLTILKTVCSSLKSHRHLALENLALRQQLAMLKQSSLLPRVSAADRSMTHQEPGYRGCGHSTPKSLAKSLCWTHIGSIRRDCLDHVIVQWVSPAVHTLRLPQVFSHQPYAFIFEKRSTWAPCIELPDAGKIVLCHRSVVYITVIFESLHESGIFYK